MKGKVAIITGASSGIGRACALALAMEGCHVAIAARSVDKLRETEMACKSHGVNAISVVCDVSVEGDCQNLVDQTIQAFGRIDILVNNAGISMRAAFVHTEIAVLQQVMAINFWGAVYCTKYALPHLLATGGHLVGVSSVAGFRGLPGRTGYSASKFAMNGFLEALRTENLYTGLHVLTLCPNYTQSNIRNTALNAKGLQQGESPLRESKLMQPEEVARRMIGALRKRKKLLIISPMGKLTVWMNRLFNTWMDAKTYAYVKKEPDSPFA
ncbi:MAG: SDR family oxidoreductase [Bacteroidetes bacterium]|jgi:short-subunit dehydrogenase|nr:SDR family oxidoreductase [Bacteroidota bacterium]